MKVNSILTKNTLNLHKTTSDNKHNDSILFTMKTVKKRLYNSFKDTKQ